MIHAFKTEDPYAVRYKIVDLDEQRNIITGFCSVASYKEADVLRAGNAYIDGPYVREDCRGRKVASRLLEYAEFFATLGFTGDIAVHLSIREWDYEDWKAEALFRRGYEGHRGYMGDVGMRKVLKERKEANG